MAETHPGSDRLLDLVLTQVPEPELTALTRHLRGCASCRDEYADLALAMDHVLAAAPRAAPPPGFEQRVLAAMGQTVPAGASRRARRARSAWFAVAAAGIVGVAAGVLGTAAILDDDAPPAAEAAAGTPFMDAAGNAVGAVTAASYDGEDVFVVDVTRGRTGVSYACWYVYDDGTREPAGRWDMGDAATATWVIPARDDLVGLELTGPSGNVWATADL